MDDNITVLVDAKMEYTKQLTTILVPYIFEGIKSIYETSKGVCNMNKDVNILMRFQEQLSQIPKWNQEIIDEEYNRIVENSGCDWLDELVTAVFLSHTKILTSIKSNKKKNKINLKIPKIDHFIHKCYIESAREVWKNPYLFSDRYKQCDYQRNIRDCNTIISESIEETIRKLLPVKSILKEYLGDNGDDNDNFVPEQYRDNLRKLVKKELELVKNKETLLNLPEVIKEDIEFESNKEPNILKDLTKPVELDLTKPVELDLTKPVELDLTKPVELDLTKPVELDLTKPEELDLTKPEELDLTKPVELDLTKPEELDLTKPVELDLTKPVELDLTKPEELDLTKPEELDLTKPVELDLTKPEELDLTKPVELDLTKPVELDLTKPEELDLTKPEELDLTKPVELDLTKPEELDLTKPVELDLTKPVGVKELEVKELEEENISCEITKLDSIQESKEINLDLNLGDEVNLSKTPDDIKDMSLISNIISNDLYKKDLESNVESPLNEIQLEDMNFKKMNIGEMKVDKLNLDNLDDVFSDTVDNSDLEILTLETNGKETKPENDNIKRIVIDEDRNNLKKYTKDKNKSFRFFD